MRLLTDFWKKTANGPVQSNEPRLDFDLSGGFAIWRKLKIIFRVTIRMPLAA